MPDIWFPYLGIKIEHLSKYAFSIGNFTISWYGIIIACAVIAGLLLARHLAKKSNQDPEIYVDFVIYAIIFGIIGARAYYVAFEWESYSGDIMKILDLRGGGLAIYGAVIASVLTAVIFCKIKRYSVLELLDTAMPGLILGQAIGRWGNFFNQEAFGSYTDGFFAMRLNTNTAAYTTADLLKLSVKVGDVRYIQVHPTFLYESFGALCILIIMLILFKHKKFKGQIVFSYMIGYGVLRSFIETLRTDQLLLWNTNIPISVVVSIVMAAAGLILMIIFGIRAHIASKRDKLKGQKNAYAPTIDGEDETAAEDEAAEETETTSEETADTQDTESEETPTEDAEAPEKSEEEKKPSDEDLWG